MVGGSGSRTGVRLGNWFEDEALTRDKAQFRARQVGGVPAAAAPGSFKGGDSGFMTGRERLAALPPGSSGRLSAGTAAILAKVSNHTQRDSLTPLRMDRSIRFGDRVVVQCIGTKTALACDVDDRISSPPDLRLRVTTAPMPPTPQARMTFVIEKVGAVRAPVEQLQREGAGTEDVVHYGQTIRLRVSELVVRPPDSCGPLFLGSHDHTTTLTTRDQGVFLADRGHLDLQWTVEAPDVTTREEMEGTPVWAGQPAVLRHNGTRKPLRTSKENCIRNDFGAEFEAMAAKTTASASRKPGAQETEVNFWSFVFDTSAEGGEGEASA